MRKSIVPDVADTIPCLFVLACVAVQRLHQAFQAALIEFIRGAPGSRTWLSSGPHK